MTAHATMTAEDVRDICDRLRRLDRIRERYAVELFNEWLTTTEGRRYEAAAGADRRDLAARGWGWVSDRMRTMAAVTAMDDARPAGDGEKTL